MPEGDTIFRAARALHRALAGRTVTGFESVFPHLTRIDVDRPLRGRTIERVASRGKHLLMVFSGDLVLRTHMRMNGSWHIYRPGERWQRPRHDMRIVIRTDSFEAVAFSVPVAMFYTEAELEREPAVRELGPDPLAADFDAGEAVRRILERAGVEIADALLDQRAIAGLGNVLKSEVLFACRVNPFARVGDLAPGDVATLVERAGRLMRVSAVSGVRQTTGRDNPAARLWVYGRAGQPCRRCGTPVSRAKQGPDARSTYWCPRCQSGSRNERAGGPEP
jgi:endonuclease-8